MKVFRFFAYTLLISTFSIYLLSLSTDKVLAVGADCSDGCDDFIPGYGSEYSCQSGTKCCTGGGCPSFACEQAGYSAVICWGRWTCCYVGDCIKGCNSEISYAETWGTCTSCSTGGGGGGGGGGSSTGTILGRIWTDLNNNGSQDGTSELWANSASTCASLKYDGFKIAYGTTTNLITAWGCNPEAWYSSNIGVAEGANNRTFELTSLPPGYDCGGVSWTYSTTGGINVKTGTGCKAENVTVVAGGNNHLWWKLSPSTKYGSVIGKIRTDYNKNGNYDEVIDGWGSTSSSCASPNLKYDGFTLTASGDSTNLISGWGCDSHPSPSYYYSASSAIATGTKSITIGDLPTGYDCSNVVWGYSTSSVASTNGTGCTASDLAINEGGVNSLWWILVKNNTLPAMTVSPTNIDFDTGNVVTPVKVAVTDADEYGELKISSSVNPSTAGTIRRTAELYFQAYGNQYSGTWPIVRIFGWRKDTGARVQAGGDIVINSATPKDFYAYVPDPEAYSHFDIEFVNDIWDAATSTGTDVFINSVRFYDDDPAWGGLPYEVQAEDANLTYYDRGDPDDGFNTITTVDRPDIIIPNGGNNYLLMAWGGSLRFPALYVSPSVSATSGTMTFTATDERGGAVSRSVTLTRKSRIVSGRIWTIPSGTPVTDAYCAANMNTGTGLPNVTVTANYTGMSGVTNSSGAYSISNVYGSISNIALSNVPTPPIYRIGCVNGLAKIATGLTTSDIVHTSPTDQIINIGLRTVDAKKWISGMGSDVYAKGEISVLLPALGCPNPSTYLCPSFTNVDHYALVYNPLGSAFPSSTVFSGKGVSVGPGNDRLTESGLTATKIGPDTGTSKFAAKNKQYFQGLSQMIKEINADTSSGYPRVTYTYLGYTNNRTLNPNSVTIMTTTLDSIYTYSSYNIPSGVAFLVIPKSGNSPVKINYLLATGNGRLIILADRNVEIGGLMDSTNTNNCSPKDCVFTNFSTGRPIPNIQATIISTGKITVKNRPETATSSPGMIIIEGSLISAGDVTLERDLGPASNELRPSLFVRYNPIYMAELNKLALNNTIPALNALFTFDFTQEEKE